RRQVIEALQAEIVEKLPRRPQKLRAARHIALADDADPAALEQRLHDVGIDGHAAHAFDLPAGDRLAIGDEGEGLKQRARVARRTLRPQARDLIGELAPHLHPKPRRRLLELDPAVRILGAELGELPPDVLARGPQGLTEQRREIIHGERAPRRQERRLDDILQMRIVHVSTTPSVSASASLSATRRRPRFGPAPRTCKGANGSACTISMSPSRTSSRMATNVTVTPILPSSGRNSRTNSTKLDRSRLEMMSDMRARTDSRSRCT